MGNHICHGIGLTASGYTEQSLSSQSVLNPFHQLFNRIGLIARRIISYMKVGAPVDQNSVAGFIKFGSRVDVLLPKNSELLVEIGDPVTGSQTPIARLRPAAE